MTRRKPRPRLLISSSQRAVRVPRKKLEALVAFVAAQEGAAVAEIDLAIVGRREIAHLNRRYLRHAGSTDVISFDLSDSSEVGIRGQLVVCADVAAEEGGRRGGSPQRELMLYVVHGLLHLMGYEDQSILGSAKMHAREDELLEAFRLGR